MILKQWYQHTSLAIIEYFKKFHSFIDNSTFTSSSAAASLSGSQTSRSSGSVSGAYTSRKSNNSNNATPRTSSRPISADFSTTSLPLPSPSSSSSSTTAAAIPTTSGNAGGSSSPIDTLEQLCCTFDNFVSIIDNAEKCKIIPNKRGGGFSSCYDVDTSTIRNGDGYMSSPPLPPSPQQQQQQGEENILSHNLTATTTTKIETLSSSAIISPISMLTRGYLGEEVALLMQYLQLHKSTICNVANQIHIIRTNFRRAMHTQLLELTNKQNGIQHGIDKVQDFLSYYDNVTTTE